MVEEQTQPQFIFWVKEAGVFRPAEPKIPESYLGYDLEKNIELGEREISPESLNLVSSVYLGPINIFEEDMEHSMSNEAFERLRQFGYDAVYGVVKDAEGIADAQGIPYFAVNIVQTSKDRTWKFEQKDDYVSKEDDYVSKDILKKNKKFLDSWKTENRRKPLEFVLHPTAQLYIPRE